ncbi:MAG: glycosyltransferase family 39 protein [Nannocystaceae bacterium]|nr:glycosyltransferase family 39 protein [Nannocystaceae bacterium]
MDWRASLLEMKPVESPQAVRVLCVLAAVSLLVALWLGLSRIDATSMWLDEAYSVVDAQRPWADMLAMRTERGTSVHPPMYSVALRGMLAMCGVNETCARLPSVLGAAGASAVLVMLAGRMFGWVAAITGAWMWPTLPYLLKYADQARGYTLLLLLSAVAIACGARVLGFWGAERWRRAATWGLALSVASMIGMHLLAATFVVPLACALLLLTRGRDSRARAELLRASVIAAILILPLTVAVGLAMGGDDTARFASAPGAAKGLKRMTHALVSLAEYTWTTPALIGAAVVLTPGRRRGLIVLGLLVALLPVVPLTVRAPSHFIVLRYFFPSVGVVGLLACAGVAALVAAPGQLPKRWTSKVPLVVLLLVGVALGGVPSRMLGQRHAKKLRKRARGHSFEPWDEASAWIAERSEPGAIIVLVPHEILWPTLRVYPVPGAHVVSDDPDPLLKRLEDDEPAQVFLVWSHISTKERQTTLNRVMRTMGRARYRPRDNEVFGRRAILVKEYGSR